MEKTHISRIILGRVKFVVGKYHWQLNISNHFCWLGKSNDRSISFIRCVLRSFNLVEIRFFILFYHSSYFFSSFSLPFVTSLAHPLSLPLYKFVLSLLFSLLHPFSSHHLDKFNLFEINLYMKKDDYVLLNVVFAEKAKKNKQSVEWLKIIPRKSYVWSLVFWITSEKSSIVPIKIFQINGWAHNATVIGIGLYSLTT